MEREGEDDNKSNLLGRRKEMGHRWKCIMQSPSNRKRMLFSIWVQICQHVVRPPLSRFNFGSWGQAWYWFYMCSWQLLVRLCREIFNHILIRSIWKWVAISWQRYFFRWHSIPLQTCCHHVLSSTTHLFLCFFPSLSVRDLTILPQPSLV